MTRRLHKHIACNGLIRINFNPANPVSAKGQTWCQPSEVQCQYFLCGGGVGRGPNLKTKNSNLRLGQINFQRGGGGSGAHPSESAHAHRVLPAHHRSLFSFCGCERSFLLNLHFWISQWKEAMLASCELRPPVITLSLHETWKPQRQTDRQTKLLMTDNSKWLLLMTCKMSAQDSESQTRLCSKIPTWTMASDKLYPKLFSASFWSNWIAAF